MLGRLARINRFFLFTKKRAGCPYKFKRSFIHEFLIIRIQIVAF